jgi:hypothetical protein
MDFRIADTFTGSLARLTAQEQKNVKSAAFDLHLNPASPNRSFHRLERARDARFWSMRITMTQPINGRNGANWNPIPSPEQRS